MILENKAHISYIAHTANNLSFHRLIFLWFSKDIELTAKKKPSSRKKKRYICRTLKPGVGSVMVWGYFSGFGIEALNKILCFRTICRRKYADYLFFFNETMIQGIIGNWLRSGFWKRRSTFYNGRHTIRVLTLQKIFERYWTIQFGYLNINECSSSLENAWCNIAREVIENLIDSLNKKCRGIIRNKIDSTKY